MRSKTPDLQCDPNYIQLISYDVVKIFAEVNDHKNGRMTKIAS